MADEIPDPPQQPPKQGGDYGLSEASPPSRPPILPPATLNYQSPLPAKPGRSALRILGITLLTIVGIVVLLFGCLLGTCAMMK